MRAITIASGVVLIGAAIWCFAHPGTAFLYLAFLLGLTMLFSGLSSILAYIMNRKWKNAEVTQWRLADGFITTVLACVVLSNQLVSDDMVPIFFGMWIVYSGTLRVLASFNLRDAGVASWKWGLLWGATSVVFGILAFIYPIVASIALTTLLGLFFLLQGINVITLGMHMKGTKGGPGAKHLHKKERKGAKELKK